MNNICATVLAVLLSAKYSVAVIVGIEDKIVQLGENIVLGCITDANGIWSYRQKTNDEAITLMENSEVNPTYKNKVEMTVNTSLDKYCLKIINVSSQDEGIYRCYKQVQNYIIQLNLQIEAAPDGLIILNKIADGIINETEGQILNITCQVIGGNTKGKIYWSNVSEFKQHFTEEDVWPFAYLNFTTDYKHHRMNLSCVVEHNMLSAQMVASVTFNVLYKPKVFISRYPAGDIEEGQHMTLECLDKSNPPKTNITWVKDDIILSSDPIHEKTNMKTNDSGTYSCIVFNSLGKEQQDIIIFVTKENGDISIKMRPLEVALIYVCVCTCGTLLFCSAACFLPLCRKDMKNLIVIDK